MRRMFKFALITLLPAVPAGFVAAADPFGRVDPRAVEPPSQVFVNPYGVTPPAKLPGTPLAALGKAVRVGDLRNAYRASVQVEAVAARGEFRPGVVSSPAAPQTLPQYQAARPMTPTAWAEAPATISHDPAVVSATFDTRLSSAASRAGEADPNPLRRAGSPVSGSSNPLR